MKLPNVQKRFVGLVGLIAIVLMMFTPVFGGKATNSRYTAKLLPVGDEPHASGVVTMTLIHGSVSGTFDGSVSCTGLTPGATYELWGTIGQRDIDFGNYVANRKGKVAVSFYGVYGDNSAAGPPTEFEVYRIEIEPTGNVLVLSGKI
jgi:hypothetical protein